MPFVRMLVLLCFLSFHQIPAPSLFPFSLFSQAQVKGYFMNTCYMLTQKLRLSSPGPSLQLWWHVLRPSFQCSAVSRWARSESACLLGCVFELINKYLLNKRTKTWSSPSSSKRDQKPSLGPLIHLSVWITKIVLAPRQTSPVFAESMPVSPGSFQTNQIRNGCTHLENQELALKSFPTN